MKKIRHVWYCFSRNSREGKISLIGGKFLCFPHSKAQKYSLLNLCNINYHYVPLFLYRLQLPKEKRLTPLQARVTSLLLQQQPSSTLWLGLGSGHLLLVNATTRIPLMAVKRQVSAVRGLLSVRALVGEKPAHLILSGGFGFQQRPTTSSHPNRGM